MGMSGISKSQLSRLCTEIDEKVHAFLDRPLEGDWPYVWLDATYVKVRQGGRIVSVAVTIAVGVNNDGRREVLGLSVGCSEAETFWTDFLRTLTRRGLRGAKLVISDAHEGLKAAIARVLNATWQRCRVHFMRNLLAHAGRNGRRQSAMAQGHRPNETKLAEAGRVHGCRGGGCPGLYGLRTVALGETALDQPDREDQRRDQAARQCRRHLPQRLSRNADQGYRPTGGRHPAGTER